MKNYKISIIIPTYNRAWCIENAIKSVINQNYDNWELIIIDDGSTDNTKKIVKKYLENNKIKYFYKENS
jgi:glycosyltransferase involved in cell wall biosynthesis